MCRACDRRRHDDPGLHGNWPRHQLLPIGDGQAAITDDFVPITSEVNPVLKALRANGIEVTAIHSHMLNQQPLFHALRRREAGEGLREALDKVALAKG